MLESRNRPVLDSLREGHPRTLFSAFMYFDVSFMTWMLIGALSVLIAQELHLTDFQKGFLVAVPLLGGAFFRIVLGLLSDLFGPKKVGMFSLLFTIIPLVWGCLAGKTFSELLGIGLLLGIAGASFAVALPLASRWYPPESQGIAMGIAGAGNSGTLFAIFLAPSLAITYHFGWHGVFGLAILPILVVFVLFTWLAQESPTFHRSSPKWSHYLDLLKNKDLWWFCLFYSMTFGGFVGLTSYLNFLYHDHYGINFLTAGKLTGLGVLLGSFFRPVGGYLADRFGGLRLLSILLLVAASAFFFFGTLLPSIPFAIFCVSAGILALGMSNGAVFQLVPLRFPDRIGIVSGIVGAFGGIGGFFFPTLLGASRGILHSDGAGFILFSSLSLMCAVAIWIKQNKWKRDWAILTSSPAESEVAIPALPSGRVPMEVVFGG